MVSQLEYHPKGVSVAVPTILPVNPYEPPKIIQYSTLVALEAEASKAVAVPDNVARPSRGRERSWSAEDY